MRSMIYIKLDNGLPVEIKTKLTADEASSKVWQSRWDWKSFEEVERLAAYLSAMTGKIHLGVDSGPCVSPQFDVIEAPRVGDEASRGFNGDYYPVGKIVRITKGLMVITEDEHGKQRRFNRIKKSGGWREVGRGFWLVSGVRDERNPSF